MKRRVVVRGVAVLDGKMHVIKHQPYEGTPVKYWCTIGGGIDDGEGLVDAVRREYIEETAIEPDVGRLLFVQQFLGQRKGVSTEFLEFIFEIKNAQDYVDIDFSKTTHGQKEIAESRFIDPADTSYNLLPTFLRDIDCNNLPKNTQYYNYM